MTQKKGRKWKERRKAKEEKERRESGSRVQSDLFAVNLLNTHLCVNMWTI